jgi:hypothetical protein
LIAAAIFFGLVDGCPIPPSQETPAWERSFVEPIRSVQQVVERPVAWMVPVLRISQRWALYQHPAIDRFRMSIEGQTADGEWHLLYRAGDPDHAEDAAILDSARVWGAYDPTDRPPRQYTGFCHWVTDRMLAHHPELVAVRVRQEAITIHPGGFEGTGKFQFGYIHMRGAP